MMIGLAISLTIAISAAIGAAIGAIIARAEAQFWRHRAEQMRRRLIALREPDRGPIPFFPPRRDRSVDRPQETSEPV